MKKKIYIVLLALLCLLACESYQKNGNLDGFWQVQTVEHYPNGQAEQRDGDLYYSFQRDMVLLGYKNPDKITGLEMTHYITYFDWEGDTLSMSSFREYHKDEVTVPLETLHKFGIYKETTRFFIEKLTAKRLILTSDSARITLQKY